MSDVSFEPGNTNTINKKIDSLCQKSQCSWFHKDEVKQLMAEFLKSVIEKKVQVKVGYLEREAVLVRDLETLLRDS